MGPSVINFDTPRRLSTLSAPEAKWAGSAWMSSHPSDLSPTSKPLRDESCPLNPIHDSRCNALTRQRGEPLNSFLRLDYDYEHEHENEREFVIRASSFPNFCSLFPAPGP
jgi:hypothetical protein